MGASGSSWRSSTAASSTTTIASLPFTITNSGAYYLGATLTGISGANGITIATNSVTPVVEAEWVAPHAHVSCVKELELGDGILERSALNVVHTRIGRPANYIVGKGESPIYDHDPQEGLAEDLKKIRGTRRVGVDLEKLPDLGELVDGRVSPAPAGALTCFVNVMGLGIQFAALGALAYEHAKARGEFSSDQISVYEERLRKSEAALRSYQESVIGQKLVSNPINESNYDGAREVISDARAEMGQIRSRLQTDLGAWQSSGGTGAGPPVLRSSRTAELESRLNELETSYGLAATDTNMKKNSATTLAGSRMVNS